MGNVHFHETPKDKIAQVCAELYQQSPENSRVVGATTAMVAEINNLIQEAVNPDGARMIFEMYGETYRRNDLRQGDVILFTQNNYEKAQIESTSSSTELPRFSGSEGYDEAMRNSAPQREKQQPVISTEPKIGRNDPCPCGSGKKFKNCHGVGME